MRLRTRFPCGLCPSAPCAEHTGDGRHDPDNLGCPTTYQTVATNGQPQTQTVYTTNTAQPTNTVVVTQAPPALQSEVVLARPSPDYVWIAGLLDVAGQPL